MTEQQKLTAIRELNVETVSRWSMQTVFTAASITAVALVAHAAGINPGSPELLTVGTVGMSAGSGLMHLLERAKKVAEIRQKPTLSQLTTRPSRSLLDPAAGHIEL